MGLGHGSRAWKQGFRPWDKGISLENKFRSWVHGTKVGLENPTWVQDLEARLDSGLGSRALDQDISWA